MYVPACLRWFWFVLLLTSAFVIVMRKEAVYTVLLNVLLFRGMRCSIAADPRYIRFSVFEGGVATHYNLRVSCALLCGCARC